MKISNFPFPPSVDQTYVCANDGTQLYIEGHVSVEHENIPELAGKAGAYAHLSGTPYGHESIYNGTFDRTAD